MVFDTLNSNLKSIFVDFPKDLVGAFKLFKYGFLCAFFEK